MKRNATIGVGAGVVLALLATAFVVVRLRSSPSGNVDATHPNVLVILTDDQTLEEMRVMDQTRSLIGDQGASFTHYYANFPNCCPSRATYYTGQYSHNDGVRDNVPPYGGFHTLKQDDTINVAMQKAGYYTAQIGKFLNQWGADGDIKPPPGWNHWFGLIDPSTYHYFDYSVSDDGTKHDYGHADGDYSTDVLGAETVRTIGEAAKTGKPFYVSFTPLSPHVESAEKSDLSFHSYTWPNPRPAPRYADTFKDEPLPKTPSFNEDDVTSKPKFIRDMHSITKSVEGLETKSYRLELETLKATDEWVGKIIQSLKDNGVYDNTLVLFTSDNGLYHGEHRIPNGKLYLYEPGVHLPLLVSGPGIPKGTTVTAPVGNVDLAATILAATGVKPSVTIDGRNVLPLIRDTSLGAGRGILLENTHGGSVMSEGIHTERFVYLESNDGTKELYDLAADPDQMQNLTGSAAYHDTEVNLAARLNVLRTCAGATCEGSDASNGKVPAGAAAPAPDPRTVSSNTIPPSAEVLNEIDAQNRATEAKEALNTLFELGLNELACAEKALTEHADLLETDGVPVLQSNRAMINAIGVSKSCISKAKLSQGMAAFLPLLTEGRLASNAAICAGRAIAGLDEAQFAAVLEYLLAPKDDPDVEAKAKTDTILTGCHVKPESVVP